MIASLKNYMSKNASILYSLGRYLIVEPRVGGDVRSMQKSWMLYFVRRRKLHVA